MRLASWRIEETKINRRGVRLCRAREEGAEQEWLLEDFAPGGQIKPRFLREIALELERIIEGCQARHDALRRPEAVTQHEKMLYLVYPWDEELWRGWDREPAPPDPEELDQWLTIMAEVLAAYHRENMIAKGPAAADLIVGDRGVLVLEPRCQSYLAAYRDKDLNRRYELVPEVTRNKPWTQASDVFLLGVQSYLLATGRLPFSGEGPVLLDNLLSEGVADPRTHRAELGPAAAAWIMALLERNIKKRPAIAQVLASMPQAGKWTAAPVEREDFLRQSRRRGLRTRWEKVRGYARRHVGLLVGGLIVLVAASIFFFSGGGEAPPAVTASTTPEQVVDIYCRGISTLSPWMLDQSMAPGVGKDWRDVIASYYVMNLQTRGVAALAPRDSEPLLRMDDLTVCREGDMPPRFTVEYSLVLHADGSDVDTVYDCRDQLSLARLPDRRVGEKWVITALDHQVLAQKNVPHEPAVYPSENKAAPPAGELAPDARGTH